MSFKNSSSYVQRQIDNLLRSHRVFARAYVNDIIIFSKTLFDHVKHLHKIFDLLNFKSVLLSSKKSFLNYSTVMLFDQKMNVFDLITTIDKLEAITKLDFFYTFKNLEIYLSLIEWFRDFIVWYAQKVDALQRRKTILLKLSSFSKDTIRKVYLRRTILENLITEELKSYRQFQEFFSQASFLIHFFDNRVLYIDIDIFK